MNVKREPIHFGKNKMLALVLVSATVFLLLTGVVHPQERLLSRVSNLMRVTNDLGVDSDPAWSPDGNKIAFISDRTELLELWMVYIGEGALTGAVQVTAGMRRGDIIGGSPIVDLSPNWSPDSNKIVFSSRRITGIFNIWIVDIRQKGLMQLTNNLYDSMYPAWSPDGTRIAFHARSHGQDEPNYIWVMNVDGTEVRELVVGEYPTWSPDSSRIAFCRDTDASPDRVNFDIWIMNADGSNLTQFTAEEEKQELYPAWSPDGKSIAYTVGLQAETNVFGLFPTPIFEGDRVVLGSSEIWMKDVDVKDIQGKGTALTSIGRVSVFPSWSPDKRRVVFSSDIGGELTQSARNWLQNRRRVVFSSDVGGGPTDTDFEIWIKPIE